MKIISCLANKLFAINSIQPNNKGSWLEMFERNNSILNSFEEILVRVMVLESSEIILMLTNSWINQNWANAKK